MGSTVSAMSSTLDAIDPTLMEIFGDTVVKGGKLFLEDENARVAFIKYFNKGNWKEKLGPQCALLDAAFDIIKDVPMNAYSEFVFSKSSSEPVRQKFLQSVNINMGSQKIDQSSKLILEDVRKRMKTILLTAVFPLFLHSPDYSNYLEAKENETNLLLFDSPTGSQKGEHNGTSNTRIDRLIDLYSEDPESSPSSLMTVVTEASQSIDSQEMHSMLQHSYGLANVFAAVENLRYCVTLATARKDRPGFPLVYVNKAFEAATGYKRKDIIGRNCSFLQSESTEKDQIQLLAKALATAQPVKVALTNRRKDGSDFLNLLAMKPMFDAKGVYSYVIGVQYVFSPETTYIHRQDFQLIDDLLYSFPNVL
eukprot:gene28439-37380_t